MNKNWENQLKNGVFLVEISGEGCASCEALFPLLREKEKERGDFTLIRIELENLTEEYVEKWEIYKVPTALLFSGGEIVARFSGYQPEEILDIWLDAKLSEIKNNMKRGN